MILSNHPEKGRPYCYRNSPRVADGQRYICTRDDEHPGSHMANATRQGTVAIWDDELFWSEQGGWR